MGSDQFLRFTVANRPRLEEALSGRLPVAAAPGTERFNEALRCAVFPGGQRLRPLLTLIASDLGGASDEQALTLSCAVEFIHTSSLVLDDLPCMDDAALRRNRPALHLAFGEGVAVLVGVALLNQAYALLASAAREGGRADRLPRLIDEAVACIGSSGMIAGQAAEFALSGERGVLSSLATRDLKTTALMRLAMTAGAVVAGADEADTAALSAFGESLGRAYQVYDDLADAVSGQQATGKSAGQDSRHGRPTAVEGLSREEVSGLAGGILEGGKRALDRFDDRPEAALLRSAADEIFSRFGVAP
jgi:geranylgeranyl diphosphate synthase type II